MPVDAWFRIRRRTPGMISCQAPSFSCQTEAEEYWSKWVSGTEFGLPDINGLPAA